MQPKKFIGIDKTLNNNATPIRNLPLSIAWGYFPSRIRKVGLLSPETLANWIDIGPQAVSDVFFPRVSLQIGLLVFRWTRTPHYIAEVVCEKTYPQSNGLQNAKRTRSIAGQGSAQNKNKHKINFLPLERFYCLRSTALRSLIIFIGYNF